MGKIGEISKSVLHKYQQYGISRRILEHALIAWYNAHGENFASIEPPDNLLPYIVKFLVLKEIETRKTIGILKTRLNLIKTKHPEIFDSQGKVL